MSVLSAIIVVDIAETETERRRESTRDGTAGPGNLPARVIIGSEARSCLLRRVFYSAPAARA